MVGVGTALAGRSAFAQDAAGAAKTSVQDKLNLGIVGVANRGGDNLEGVSGQNIAALCDIDDNYLTAAGTRFPQAKRYNDFRKLLDQKGLDAVVVSTPDHMHAPIAAAALKAGLHVYCEKPLAHTVYEARMLAELAKKHKRTTQMGTQIHATSNYRRVVEIVQAGVIGKISEVHVWVGRVWSGPRQTPSNPPVPPNIHWDLWQGVAPERPYDPNYLPAYWRGYWLYGNGTLGDMGCHHMDLPHWALGLRAPETVTAEGPPVDSEIAAPWLMVHYDYPARGEQPPVKLTWYHGEKRPSYFAEGKLPQWGDGTLFVGEKGMLIADYDRYVLLPEKDFTDFKGVPHTIPESIGHYEEWFAGIRTGSPTLCNFDYSGALSEAVLLGAVAYRSGQSIQWDAKGCRVTNSADADALIHPHYRHGWRV
jgi:predicted dehydrogenase